MKKKLNERIFSSMLVDELSMLLIERLRTFYLCFKFYFAFYLANFHFRYRFSLFITEYYLFLATNNEDRLKLIVADATTWTAKPRAIKIITNMMFNTWWSNGFLEDIALKTIFVFSHKVFFLATCLEDNSYSYISRLILKYFLKSLILL